MILLEWMEYLTGTRLPTKDKTVQCTHDPKLGVPIGILLRAMVASA